MTHRTTRRFTVAGLLTVLVSGVMTLVPLAPSPTFAAGQECSTEEVIYTPVVPIALDKLQYKQAWEVTRGRGIVVAVVDSGIDANNAHLRGIVVGGVNLVGDGENAQGFTDHTGHGTAIAGQIAAQQIPESGVVGLAPAARLLSVRVFRAEDEQSVRDGFGPSTARIAAGITWAADAGAEIINVSLSEKNKSSALESAVKYAVSKGSLVVASAGNARTTDDSSDGPRYPGAYPGALAVAASDPAGVVTDDSIHGPHVDIAAPGSEVLTAATGSGDCMYATEAPATSYATGYVSGAAALVASAHPKETPAQWAFRLMATATRSSPDARDDRAGWGVVQPLDAIHLLPSPGTRGPSNPFFDATDNVVKPPTTVAEPVTADSGLLVTQQTMLLVAVAGLTLLGTIAVIIVLRARRREVQISAPVTSGGLLDRDDSTP